MRRAARIVSVAAVSCAALASRGFAHGNGVLDLESMETLAAERSGTATGAERKAWRALDRALGREIRRPLIDEIAKLRAVSAACARRLASETELLALLGDATIAAGVLLDGEPDDVAAITGRLERAAERAKVGALAARALADHVAGDAVGLGGDAVACLRLYQRSAVRFADAKAAAQRFLVKQARRDAPGQVIARGPRGTIDTWAGSGAPGAGTEGLPARAAPFYFPQDVAIDPRTGLLHVADLNNHRIRRIDADGRVRTVAGNGRGFTEHPFGPAREADLHHPAGMAFDPVKGDLVVAAWHQSRILRLDGASGEMRHLSGDGTLGFAGDSGPVGDARMDYPVGVVFAADGSWFVSDQGNRRIRRVDGATGIITTVAGTGEAGFAGDGGPALQARFDLAPGRDPGTDLTEPAGRIALSPDGRTLYVADTGNRRVRSIDLSDPSMPVTTIAGDGTSGSAGDGGPATAASLSAPVDVECDVLGNVFVCDRDAEVVRRIDVVTGTISAIAGSGTRGYGGDGGPAVSARLDLPSGICVDRVRGRLYVADAGNHVIRVVWE